MGNYQLLSSHSQTMCFFLIVGAIFLRVTHICKDSYRPQGPAHVATTSITELVVMITKKLSMSISRAAIDKSRGNDKSHEGLEFLCDTLFSLFPHAGKRC